MAVGREEIPAGGRDRAAQREAAGDRIGARLVHPAVDEHAPGGGDRDDVSGAHAGIESPRVAPAGVEENLEVDPHRRAGRRRLPRPGRCRAPHGHELDHPAGLLGRPAGRPDEVGERRPRASEGIEAGALDAADHRDDPAAVLRDLHAHLRRAEDPGLHEAPRDLRFQLGRGEPLGPHQADQGKAHVAAGIHAHALHRRCRRHGCRPRGAEPRPRPRALHVDQVRDADLEQIVRSDPVPAVRGLERAFGGERFETGSVPGAHHVARHDGRRGFGLPGVRADLGSRPEAAAAAERKPDQERDACRSEDHEGDRVGQSGKCAQRSFPCLPWQQARCTTTAGRRRSMGHALVWVRTSVVPVGQWRDAAGSARAGDGRARPAQRRSIAADGLLM